MQNNKIEKKIIKNRGKKSESNRANSTNPLHLQKKGLTEKHN
jgi:hypothetical protein